MSSGSEPQDADLFKVHILNEAGKLKAHEIAVDFAFLLGRLSINCPHSREMAIVKTKLQEACFFAKRAMASRPENQEP